MSGQPTPSSPVPNPDLRALLRAHATDIFQTLNCHKVGKVISFDAATQTISASIQGLYVFVDWTQNPPAPVPKPYPVLSNVPVFINSGGAGSITFPIAVGDPCLILFNDRDIDNWFSSGGAAAPNTPRCHDLSDGMALVGFRSMVQALTAYSTTDAQIRLGTSIISVGSKISIANSAGSFINAMDAFLTACIGWVNTGGSTPNPATVTALMAAKTEFDAIFKT